MTQIDIEIVREAVKQGCKFTRHRLDKVLEALSRIEAATMPELPEGWHVSWMGKDKDGMFVAQLKLTEALDPDAEIDDYTMTFVSRVGYLWPEALRAAIAKINEAGDECGD